MLKKMAFAGLLMAAVGQASAAQVVLSNLTIKSYRWYWDGANTVVEVEVNEPITTNGCAPSDYNASTNPNPRFAHWVSGSSLHPHNQYTLSMLTAAEAQGKKIDILYESAYCHGVSGRMIYGVKIRQSS